MSDTTHVVEVNQQLRVRLFSAEPLGDEVVVLAADCFDYNADGPSTDDRVTAVSGSEVIRGKVVAILFLVAVDS